MFVDSTPSSPFFPAQSGQAVEGVNLWFIVEMQTVQLIPFFCY